MKLYRRGPVHKGDVFPLDHFYWAKAKRLDTGPIEKTMAIYRGEKRTPLKGELYLSGCDGYVTAYQAPNDLSSSYMIAEQIIVVISEVARRIK